MLTDAARERTRRFPPRYGGRVGIRVVGASARRPTRNGLLEPNVRRVASLGSTADGHAVYRRKRMAGCQSTPPARGRTATWGRAERHPSVNYYRRMASARLLASHPPPAEAVTEAPGLGRTRVGAATPPALQNRPRMRHGPAAPEGRQPDGGARATVRRLWSIPPRARRPLTTKEAFVSNDQQPWRRQSG